jgi:hypothetical protein
VFKVCSKEERFEGELEWTIYICVFVFGFVIIKKGENDSEPLF